MSSDSIRPLLKFPEPSWSADLQVGMTTKVGFPLAGTEETDEHSRAESRRILAEQLKIDVATACWLKQVHGAETLLVREPGFQGHADALVSATGRDLLLVSVADCGPVLLADRQSDATAAIHAGWRGVVAGVLENSIEVLASLGAEPKNLQAWVGPCIGPERFEVSEEVAQQFSEPARRPPPRDGANPFVDLPLEIENRLIAAGIAPAAITVDGDCTFDSKDIYWSYRRDGGICGRQLAFIHRLR